LTATITVFLAVASCGPTFARSTGPGSPTEGQAVNRTLAAIGGAEIPGTTTDSEFSAREGAGLLPAAIRGRFSPRSYGSSSLISLSNGLSFDTRVGEPTIPVSLKSRETTAASFSPAGLRRAYLVQLRPPLDNQARAALENLGAKVQWYVPTYAFLVRMDEATRAKVERLSSVRWVGRYHPAYKLSAQEGMRNTTGEAQLVVMLFSDADLNTARAEAEAAGVRVLEQSESEWNKILKVSADLDRLADLAAIEDVLWIEPWHAVYPNNNRAQWVVQSDSPDLRSIWDRGLRGEGQITSTCDSGIRPTHDMFYDPADPVTGFGDYPNNRKIVGYQTVAGGDFGDEASNGYHGTHTAGTVCGDDSITGGSSPFDGMAPNARIYFMDGGKAGSGSIWIPLDLNYLYVVPYNGNARLMSNSWGGGTAGAYDGSAMTTDQFMWNHKDFLVFFSNGNEGPGPRTVGPPATAKNCVSVGASLNGTNASSMASFSSRGPTSDSRIKPTLVAPGDGETQWSGMWSAYGAGDHSYINYQGTSMSSPCAAGAVTLIRQYLDEGWYPLGRKTYGNGFSPSAALMKAMAVNSAQDDYSVYVAPDNNVGWGRVNVDSVLYFEGESRRLVIIDNTIGLTTGEYVEYQFRVADNTIPLKATLVWTDYPGSPLAGRQLVNDLDLLVSDGATPFLGNYYFNGESAYNPQASPDTVNVEENVRLNPGHIRTSGAWTVRVSATNVPFGPQPFALVVSGGLAPDAGVVSMDKGIYYPGDTIHLRVDDPNAYSMLTVELSSSTERAPELITCTGGRTGIFRNVVPVSAGLPVNGDGKLSVSDADTIWAVYHDQNPVATVHATARASIAAPVITDVAAGDISPYTGRITWKTSIGGTSRVFYGTDPERLDLSTPLDQGLTYGHSVLLTGLSPNLNYYYDVESRSPANLATRDDNGGLHYTLTTKSRNDVILVVSNDSLVSGGGETWFHPEHYDSAFARNYWTFDTWLTGTQGPVAVGDLQSGLRSYKAVVWQTGFEQYPPFTSADRETIARYHDGGGRYCVFSHDAAWALADGSSGYSTPATVQWLADYLKLQWITDPPTIGSIMGVAGDTVTGPYSGGVSYTTFRSGGAGDEIRLVPGTGSGVSDWLNNGYADKVVGVRWSSLAPLGSPDSAVWGGKPSKVSTNCFEWTQLNAANPTDTTRADILGRTLSWLLDRPGPPHAVLTAPAGGETLSTPTVNISWTESPWPGYPVTRRSLYYSANGGQGWTLLADDVGPSPYTWDVTSVPNGLYFRLRIVLADSGDPSLRSIIQSSSDFVLDRLGGDTQGPVIVAGSARTSPNPPRSDRGFVLSATVTDYPRGGSNIAAGEWSIGFSAATAGSGNAMEGSFDSPEEVISDSIDGSLLKPQGTDTVWVRGKDASDNWGNASPLYVSLGGTGIEGEGNPGQLPRVYALLQNAPNPFGEATTIRYQLPKPGKVALKVFNILGQEVATLAQGDRPAGYFAVRWNGRDHRGQSVAPGIYFYKFEAGDFAQVRRLMRLR
jgi:hypothetical protein